MTAREVLHLFQNVKRCADGWTARCPAHEDAHNSLSLSAGDGGRLLLYCHANAGCTYEDICRAVGIEKTQPSSQRRVVASYDYRDEEGVLLYQAVRYEPKGFSQRKPGDAGGWEYKLNGVRRVLYGLPELLASGLGQTVFVVEGEKDADRLARSGFVATTNAGGAGKWRDEYSEFLRGRAVVIVPDNDAPGREHAAKVSNSLHGVASSVRVLSLPDLPPKGDVSDWLAAGHTTDELRALAERAPEPEPTPTQSTEPRPERKSQATLLIELADGAELFHAPDGKAFATVEVNGHRETLPLRSSALKDWLSHRYYVSERSAPSASALQDALSALSGRARFEGAEVETFVRVAGHAGNIYLDLCDRDWRAVEITPEGWRVVTDCPVKFRRPRGMLALPEPVRGGSVSELRRFVNVGSDAGFTLLLAWLVAAFRPTGPYPALGLHGEQGSAKSTSARLLRALVDPNAAGLRSEPREDRDLMIAATNGWCVAFDNLSKIPLWLSDGLCRLATGGGFTARELYTNDEEVLFDAQRPVVLNGIEEVATRPDLLDRAIILGLPTIPEERRMKESALWREFNVARPRILGALLDAVAVALRNESQVTLARLPRMADFAVWATAAEPGLGLPEGSFLAAYERNRASANDLALEASAVAPEILRVMANRDSWTVTYTALLSELERVFGDSPKRPEGWPKSARGLAGELTRVAVNLRKAGVDVVAAGRQSGTGRKLVTLTKLERRGDSRSQCSQCSQTVENEGSPCEHCCEEDSRRSQSSQQYSQDKPNEDGFCEDCERGECHLHPFSNSSESSAFTDCDNFFTEQTHEEAERGMREGHAV